MKDWFKALIALGVCVVVVLAGILIINMYIRRNEAKDYVVNSERYGFVRYWDDRHPEESTVVLLKTYEEYEQCKEDILNGGSVSRWYKEKLESYDKEFFETKDLILKYYVLTSGSMEIEVKRLDVKDGVANLVAKTKRPANGLTDDMSYWAVFVEVSKENGIKSVETQNAE